MKLPSTSNHKGFTLIEILVVLGLVSLIAAIGFVLSLDFYKTYAFKSEQIIAVSVLQKARNQAMSNINEQPHGVKMLPGKYVIYQGASYATRDTSMDEEISISPTISHSGLNEVVFAQLRGNAVVSGSNLVISGFNKNATITINAEGQIDVP